MTASSPLRFALVALASTATLSCHNLDGFDTKPGEAYCAALLSPHAFQDGFVPAGSRPTLELALSLDTSKLTSEPGILRSNDASTGLCASSTGALFQDAPLRAIPEVDHDVLSQLSFGEGHEHDFFAWVDSSCQGTMLAVVSLMKNDQVEVRLFKPARLPAPNATPDETPGFALFLFHVQKDGCGF